MAGALVILVGLIWQANARPLLADRHSWRATRALAEGDAQEALAEYSAAVAFEPRRAAYHVALALTAAQLGGFARAEGAMFAAIAQRPADPALYAHLAAIYAREAQDRPERLPLAFTAYERAIALAPTLALTYQQYADLALRTGDWGTAAALATRAVELDATDGLSYAILGWAHLEAGDLPAASKAFLNANRWRETADARVGLATVYLQQGHIDAARSEVARSLAIDPGFAPAVALQLQLQSDACCSGSIPLQEQK